MPLTKETGADVMRKCAATYLESSIVTHSDTISWLAAHIGILQDKHKSLEKRIKKLEKICPLPKKS